MIENKHYFLQNLFIYPIKSLRGVAFDSINPEKRGLPFDRRWVLLDESSTSLTQRDIPEMTLISVSILEDRLELHHATKQMAPLIIPFKSDSYQVQPITVWDDHFSAPVSQDPAISDWFYHAMGYRARLAFMDVETSRPVDPRYAPEGEEVSFSDGFPFLITNQASLDELNSRLPEPVPMDRFRPNLVISGGEPFEEDDWKKVIIGEAEFEVVKPSGRCIVITINQETAEKNKEPLKTLATFRKKGNKIIFGQNMILKKSGLIKVGDEVKIIKTHSKVPGLETS